MRSYLLLLLTLTILILTPEGSLSQEKVAIKPISIGAFNGNARDSYPELVIINQYPQIYTSVAGSLYLIEKHGNLVDGYVSMIVDRYELAIKKFLQEARSFAVKNSAPVYGVHNLKIDVEQGENNLIVTVTGDIFCGRLR